MFLSNHVHPGNFKGNEDADVGLMGYNPRGL
jgi:hypothetical protein